MFYFCVPPHHFFEVSLWSITLSLHDALPIYHRVFGCTCYIHNNGKDPLGKFDARGDEGTFLGYSSRSKAYKVLNHRTCNVEESIHVKFKESTNLVPQEAQNGENFEIPTQPQIDSMTPSAA